MKPCNNKSDDAAGVGSTQQVMQKKRRGRKEGRKKQAQAREQNEARWSQVSWQPNVEPLRAWRAGDLPREPPLAPEADRHDDMLFLALELSDNPRPGNGL